MTRGACQAIGQEQRADSVAYTIAGEHGIAVLGPEDSDLDHWMSEAPGRAEAAREAFTREPAAHMMEDGPLRHALLAELAFQAIAEDKATRALSALIPAAPDSACLEFYTGQLMDEARHRRLYRRHMVRLGVPEAQLDQVIEEYAGAVAETVLGPVEAYGLDDMAEHQDFHRGVLIVTVLVEGVIAPITELSELKWRPLDPGAALVQRTANSDESRHLAVGSTIVRRHLSGRPELVGPFREMVEAGRAMWQSLPMADMQLMLEQVFQEGMEKNPDIVGDYEIWPGRRMLETTAEERARVGQEWARQIQDERLEYMLLA